MSVGEDAAMIAVKPAPRSRSRAAAQTRVAAFTDLVQGLMNAGVERRRIGAERGAGEEAEEREGQ